MYLLIWKIQPLLCKLIPYAFVIENKEASEKEYDGQIINTICNGNREICLKYVNVILEQTLDMARSSESVRLPINMLYVIVSCV